MTWKRLEARSLDCPECKKAMLHGTLDRTIIDVCPLCIGIWFDEGEFKAVFRFDPATGSYSPGEKAFGILAWVVGFGAK